MCYKVMDVAQYIINFSAEQKYELTNLKLQKLLYYVQGAFLIEKSQPCFEESIKNWRHGPVVPEVYRRFKIYGSNAIEYQDEYSTLEITEFKVQNKIKKYSENPISYGDKEIINKVIRGNHNYDAWEMVERTHEEDPWRIDTSTNDEITNDSIKKYFISNTRRIYGD